MKKLLVVCCCLCLASLAMCASVQQKKMVLPTYNKEKVTGTPVVFDSIYGFLPVTHVNRYAAESTINGIGYFAVDVDSYGDLCNIPRRSDVPKSYKGKVDLVAVCNNSRALAHFVLSPDYDKRNQIIKGLVEATKDFDGLVIDYELIPARDAEHFITFLHDIKRRLPKHKTFSVCVPARLRTLKDDIFPYKTIGEIADKVYVMAYDEHWSSSKPGSVASMDWCYKVAEYALTQIPADKLVMGLPFYGRAWSSPNMARAVRYETAFTDLADAQIYDIERDNSVPHVSFTKEITVELWFEDVISIIARCRLYQSLGVKHIAFWCLGQEDTDVWQWLKTAQ